MERETNVCQIGDTDTFCPSTLKLYEAQFFGFTPQTCMLRIYSSFRECLCEILRVVEKVCVRKLRTEPDSDRELRSRARECSQKLHRLLEKGFERVSERMEALLISSCFSVPPNVLLPEDQPHRQHPQGLEVVLKLESSLAELHRAYEAEIYARQALLSELEEQKEVQEELDGILRWIGEIQAGWGTEGMGSFYNNFQLVMESVKKLQDTLEEICNKVHRKVN
ncbi:protein MIS12 homolog [Lampris incognitus]|uniref:protein MIS12 homolog n=1 Tax=Lampris incognitus TaxID=2546036 RepID=UPI0024B539D8|nr:protein MIS12 homolog [Lampris incognitus]